MVLGTENFETIGKSSIGICKGELYEKDKAHSVKKQLSDYMGLIFEIMHRFLEKAEIIIIIFSQNGINGRLIQAQ